MCISKIKELHIKYYKSFSTLQRSLLTSEKRTKKYYSEFDLCSISIQAEDFNRKRDLNSNSKCFLICLRKILKKSLTCIKEKKESIIIIRRRKNFD